MSSAQRVWLLAAVMVATLVGYLGVGSSIQEAETQDRPGNSSERGPSFPTSNEEEFAPDRILVKLKEGTPEAALDALNRQNNAGIDRRIPRTKVDVVRLPRDLPVQAAVRRYEANPNVEYAEPDFVVRPSQTTSTNDPRYSSLYGLNNTGQSGGTADADVDAPEAWNTTTGDAGTVVAVIDTGMDISHDDLENNIWTNPGEIAGNGIDDDGNKYVDDVNGYDFANNDKTVYDSGDGDTHGTHVAGTIAAEGNNNVGVVGVNWRAKIMPLKFLAPDPDSPNPDCRTNSCGSTSDAVEALNYAVANGAKISNNSWGGGGYSQTLYDAISRADASGHLFVAAAGNDGVDNDSDPHYPSSYGDDNAKTSTAHKKKNADGTTSVVNFTPLDNVIAVAATDSTDALASFSNYGSASVDLAAPGVGILSTLPGNTYGSYNGTSMATPHVTGAAALAKSNDYSLDDTGMKAKLLESVDKKSALLDKTATGGRLNAAQALGAPRINSVSPASGKTGVSRYTKVTAKFSEQMDPSTLDSSTVTLVRSGSTTPVAATVSYDAQSQTVTLNPSVRLGSRATYQVTIKGGGSGAKDLESTPLVNDKVWKFKTGRR